MISPGDIPWLDGCTIQYTYNTLDTDRAYVISTQAHIRETIEPVSNTRELSKEHNTK